MPDNRKEMAHQYSPESSYQANSMCHTPRVRTPASAEDVASFNNQSSGGFVQQCSATTSVAALSLFVIFALVSCLQSEERGGGVFASRGRDQASSAFQLIDSNVLTAPSVRYQPRTHQKNGKKKPNSHEPMDPIAAAKRTGIDIVQEGNTILWTGSKGGMIKPVGPLLNRRIGVVLASEFSDFQVYYLASYIGEYGGLCDFLTADWVKWKFTRPNVPDKGVRGMWDVSVDPMPVMAGSNKADKYRSLRDADPRDYDAVIVVGGHSADVLNTEAEVIDFIKAAEENGAVMGSIGAGSMPFISAGIMKGKKCTGNALVEFMLKRIAKFQTDPVVVDDKLITARDTIDTPAFLRALAQRFDPSFVDVWEGSLSEKKIMLLIGEDYEDIEAIVPVLEWIYRGADVIIARFDPQYIARPWHTSDVAVGNFGTTIPFQEIPQNKYTIKKLKDVSMSDFDVAVITGAFNPWNMVATGTSDWLREARDSGKPIAAICHGPIPVAAADLVEGKKVTGWLASKDPVEIMGGTFNPGDWAAVIDGQLITARTPPELPEFIDAVSVALLL